MSETLDSGAEKSSEEHYPGESRERFQSDAVTAVNSWKENLKDNFLIVIVGSVVIGFLVGYLIAQHQEAHKREQWAEILFRQARDWLRERSRKAAGPVKENLEYARSVAEQAAEKGAKYSQRLNPFHRELRRRFLGIL